MLPQTAAMTSKAVVAGTVLLFAAIATASLVRASVAGAAADFVTPRQAAGCGVSEGEPPFRLICWTSRWHHPRHDATMAAGEKGGSAQSRFLRPGAGEDPLLRKGLAIPRLLEVRQSRHWADLYESRWSWLVARPSARLATILMSTVDRH